MRTHWLAILTGSVLLLSGCASDGPPKYVCGTSTTINYINGMPVP